MNLSTGIPAVHAESPVRSHCPGCSSGRLGDVIKIVSQPVILNYRFPTPMAASDVLRRDIELVECNDCGLVFNHVFDPAIVPYDENYENRQDQSGVFRAHMEDIAFRILNQTGINKPRILEIGCGKGVFLEIMVNLSGGRGVGYDTSYDGPEAPSPNLAFHRCYLSPEMAEEHFDVVVCRHVVEHVPEIGNFLKNLHAIADAVGEPAIFIETPRLEWILASESFWDIFNEHCNYYTENTLALLARQAGFDIAGHSSIFQDQYQLLQLRKTDPRSSRENIQNVLPLSVTESLRSILSTKVSRIVAEIEGLRQGGDWAIWGAGAKGVCLTNRILKSCRPRLAFDLNPAKQGSFVPGTPVPIVEPSSRHLENLSLVVVMNPTYEHEIRRDLQKLGYRGETLVLNKELHES